MENQQEIGGAQALLQLGSKNKEDEELEVRDIEEEQNIDGDEEKHENSIVNAEVGDDEVHNAEEDISESKTTNQQINDAVEAAVMRYVGSTLDETPGNKRKRKMNHDDIMHNINEFNQWTGFLDDEIANNEEFGQYPSHPKTPKSSKKKKTGVQTQSNNEIDPELTGLDTSTEHDQLVQAAIIDARELAKHLGNGSLGEHDVGSSIHHSLNGLPPHQAQQVIAAATAAVQNNSSNPESVTAINQLVQAASSLSSNGNKGKLGKQRKPLKKIDGTHQALNSGSNETDHMGAIQRNPAFNHLTSVDALVEEAAAQACTWYNNLPQTSGNGPRIFSREEISAVDHFISGYCHLHKLSRRDICNRIWSNERKKDNFWESLTRVLPYRSRASVYKHVRRQYHVFEVRAKWTKEDDSLLSKLAATKEGNWKEIGETMGRMPEDCRDRWRNYVKCGENRVLNKWSEEEEKRLREIVSEMLSAPDIKDRNKAMNWTIVSERMNGVRSRIQCRYKWNKLVKRESSVRAAYMSDSTRIWLFQALQKLGFQTADSIDWDYIVHLFNEEQKVNHSKLNPNESWIATDFKVGFDKMKIEIKDHRRLPLQTIIQRLIDDFYNRQKITGHNHQEDQLGQQAHQSSSSMSIHINPSNQSQYSGSHEQAGDHDSGNVDHSDATSIASAAVAAVSSGVGDDTQQQDYNLWR